MTFLDRVVIRRANEQTAAIISWPLHDPDSWDFRRAPKRERPRAPKRCRIGGCPSCGKWRGLCHIHYMRRKRGSMDE